MNSYASLFGPRSMKPNPSSSDAIRDPLGRDSHLWDQEEEVSDIGGKLEAARADWRGDASLNSLFGVGGAFKLEDTVGKQGKNRPGDVFKVQSLLHREGFLDADKTEGPTGYWGMFDHDAIEKFQKENGLKVDGWMGPKGETIQAFESIYAPAKTPQQTQQPTGQLPWKDYSGNLLDNDAWDALLSRLPAWYRPEPRQDAGSQPLNDQPPNNQPMAETLSGGSGADNVAPMQLAQQEDSPQAPADAKGVQDSAQSVQTPGASKAWLEKQEADRRFEDAHKMTRKAEGGYSNDPDDPGKETNHGITEQTLADYHRINDDPSIPKDVSKLQPKHAEHILRRMHYDLNRIGEILDPSLARHIYDASVNPSPQKAARWVQQEINAMNGDTELKVDGRMGPETIKKINSLDGSQVQELNRRLSETREKHYERFANSLPEREKFRDGLIARARAYRQRGISNKSP